MNLFCRFNLHWPMKREFGLFTDIVSGKTVFQAHCPCKRKWMIDTLHNFPLFKVELKDRAESRS